jgi:hypothetical protein
MPSMPPGKIRIDALTDQNDSTSRKDQYRPLRGPQDLRRDAPQPHAAHNAESSEPSVANSTLIECRSIPQASFVGSSLHIYPRRSARKRRAPSGPSMSGTDPGSPPGATHFLPG